MNFNNDYQTLAIQFFLTKIAKYKPYQRTNILEVQEIHCGFTNKSFLFTMDDNQKFQVRLGGSNDVVDRINEAKIIKILNADYYYFLDKNGNAIKRWIEGEIPTFRGLFKKRLLKLLAFEIIKLHQVNVQNSTIIKHNYFAFWNQAKITPKHAQKYQELFQKYQDLPLVLSHNDINPDNMIYNKKTQKIHLIDFEWGRLNNAYWDYANFFRETNLPIKYFDYLISFDASLNPKIAKDFIYLSTNFAFQWTFGMQPTTKILEYRKLIENKLEKYWNLVC